MRALGIIGGAVAVLGTAAAAVILLVTAFGPQGVPHLRPGLDFQGGTRLEYRVDAPDDVDAAAAAREARKIVARRLEALGGVAGDATVRARGDRLIVELAGSGSDELAAARAGVGSTTTLELRAVDDRFPLEEHLPPLPRGVRDATEIVSAGRDHPSVQATYLQSPEREPLRHVVESMELPDRELALGRESRAGEAPRWRTYVLRDEAVVDGTMVADAEVQSDRRTGQPVVWIEFDGTGTRAFARMTERNIKRRIAILIDGEVVSAPVVMTRIPGGRAQITFGSYRGHDEAAKEAREVAAGLRSGALPQPLVLEHETVIEPTLETGTIGAWAAALAVGALLVAGACVFRYRLRAGALLLSPMVVVCALAVLAILDATYNAPFVLALVGVAAVAAAAAIGVAERSRRWPDGHPLVTVLLGAAPVALLAPVGGVLYAFSGPVRAVGIVLLTSGSIGTPLAALWSFALAAIAAPRERRGHREAKT